MLTSEPTGWIEINLRQLRRNWELILEQAPAGVEIAAVVKDDAYSHGAVAVARTALEMGAKMLVVAAIDEATELRRGGITSDILVLGERRPEDFGSCLQLELAATVGADESLRAATRATRDERQTLRIHLKIDTGMSRYGFRWCELEPVLRDLAAARHVQVEGIMSHFSMSDELDKSFAELQLSRFQEATRQLHAAGIYPHYTHICNSGGFLDLPQAHFNLVRLGILPLGVYPSRVCRRIAGISPVMGVRSRVGAVKELRAGDQVGYGMRFTAPGPMRIGIVPVGYGAGFPRVRIRGRVLVGGRSARIIGGVSMDAIIIDLTETEVRAGDLVTLLGREGGEEITVEELAGLRSTVSYDIMTSWNARLPRKYIN